MSLRPVVYWFRNDLRLADNAALSGAVASGAPVVCIYVLDDVTPGRWRMGGASRWWLHHSLAALARDLEMRGNRLVLFRGDARDIVPRLVQDCAASAVYCSRAYEPSASQLETLMRETLAQRSVDLKRFGGALLKEPEDVRTGGGTPYSVYTPFWRALSSGLELPSPRPAPKKIPAPKKLPEGVLLAAFELLPKRPDWAGGLRAHWTPGEAGAAARLETFVGAALEDYARNRDRPDLAGTSRLSPHLHFGEITPAACWRRATSAAAKNHWDVGCETFLKELVWREFSYHLLSHWPELPEKPFRSEFAAFPWAEGPVHFAAWKRGRTGYPIVDAGMRELWQTGYMHNRVRMIAASFLVKDLLVPWQAGEAWFWDTLVDADLASNAASWQWVAGSGADAAPYFRIFNPVLQGAKFDSSGDYVRRYVPEIARLPDRFIHTPWLAPEEILRASNIVLGMTYPSPIVDHAAARARALDAYARVRNARDE